MFKKHPKGLLAAALSNMGERFGFYIMMAILSLFLMSKFGLDKTTSSLIGSIFYGAIYILALVGGLIADKTKKYKSIILTGLVLMTLGYVFIAIPTPTPAPSFALVLTCIGLFIIAFGNGLFKGNLQAVVGQMYDNPKYSDKRDVGFQIFYMFINVGAMFAPVIAVGIRNWWVVRNGFTYNADLPALCHGHLSGTLKDDAPTRFADLSGKMLGVEAPTTEQLTAFSNEYLNVFNTGYHYAFAIAIVAMLISLVVYLMGQKKLPNPADKIAKAADANEVQMDIKEIRQRLYALFAVFAVVIFFWFSFHQNGHTLTYFANDYTKLSKFYVDLGFVRLEGAELFQLFNPLFVVFLTPVIIGFLGWLKAKGKEPSTPRKIAIGMGIATLAFVVMAFGSYGLPDASTVKSMGGLDDVQRVTPWLLIGTYFILTVAELFISPLGLSFVSKVAPPQYQGIMQGCWLGTTAIANSLLFLGVVLFESIPIWATWMVFVGVCLVSMFMMLGMIKWLERITKA